MRNINDLVNYETVEDIFLELNDYKKFSFSVQDVKLQQGGRLYSSSALDDWFQRKEFEDEHHSYIIHTCELVRDPEVLNITSESPINISEFGFTPSFKMISKKFKITKTPKIGKISPGEYWLNFPDKEAFKDEDLIDTIKRCKLYLGDDLYKIKLQKASSEFVKDILYIKFNSYEAIEINDQ